MRARYALYGLAVVGLVLALQAAMPHRLEEGRSVEVLGKLNHYLKWRPRGVSLAQLSGAFEWDLACAVKADVYPADFESQTGIRFPEVIELRGEGDNWLLVFAHGTRAVAVAQVPVSSMGDIEQDRPYHCVEDQNAFLTVIERQGEDGPPRHFILRS